MHFILIAMGGGGKGKRQDVPSCSRMPPSPAADGRELEDDGRPQTENEQLPRGVYKRCKKGIQLLNARRADSECSYVKATCSSSMARVCDVFASFDAEKRSLVEEIDFGGMLRLPRSTEVDPRFSLWLMRSIETSDRPGLCFHTRNVHGIICRDVDVHLMFGVPFEGVEISLGEAVSDKIVRVVRKLLALSFCSFPISMAEVQDVLMRSYGSSMSYEQRAGFKIAVVLFVVTHFLAPNCCTPEFANTEILKHLLYPDNIRNVNWAGYFIKCIKREAARLKDELRAGRSAVVIHGCPAIPKIFYLDNMAFGERSPFHDVFPRISVYNSELMHLLVTADTKKDYMSSLDMYGITKPREKSDVCYSRGFASRSVNRGVVEQKRELDNIGESQSSSDLHDIIHFGLKLIDEHGINCSDLLKDLADVKNHVEESVDHMRSRWISYSVRKQEARVQKGRRCRE